MLNQDEILSVIRDITELKRLQEQDLQRAALEERQRLARDLHDAVSQTLFSARVTSEMLLRQKKSISQRALWKNIVHFSDLVKGALGEMRILLMELRPESLSGSGLPVLLSHLVDAAASRVEARINLDVRGKCELPVNVKVAFYRIAQEALNNIIKYAACSQVNIRLLSGGGSVQLTVDDNGVGFNLAGVGSTQMGLRIMRERANETGAELKITSAAGRGTRVSCVWKA